jgi:hypothetical protein
MRRVLSAVLCALVAACTTPYLTPTTDDGTAPKADGSLTPAADFDGIGDVAKRGSTRVVWVHGMCTHDERWATERFNLLSQLIGFVPGSISRPDLTNQREARSLTYAAEVASAGSAHDLQIDFLLWSPLNDPYKHNLFFDRPRGEPGGQFPYRRAGLNGKLKVGLLNDCFIDAVAYAGPNGAPIRTFMKSAVCEALGGSASSGRCEMGNAAPPDTTVLVAESLGSKMLFDAIRAIAAEQRTVRAAVNLTAQLQSVQLVFLLANQLPLLDAADQTPESRAGLRSLAPGGGERSQSSLVDFLQIRQGEAPGNLRSLDAGRSVELKPVKVVAFTDPNDLLSYRLDPARLGLEKVSVANVIVSNAPTYFGLFEMPDAAHCGYQWNPFVIGAVAAGYKEGVLSRTAIPLKEGCGLLDADPGQS